MKTSIKTFICALALAATALSTYAEDKENQKTTGFGVGIFANKAGKINVLINKAEPVAATTIKIKNDKGDVYYSETIAKDHQKFGRILDVDALEQGNYQIEISSKGEIHTKTFVVSEPTTERVISVK